VRFPCEQPKRIHVLFRRFLCSRSKGRRVYSQLVSKFGEPSNSFDNYKSDAEWQIEFEDGTVATIYNWKDGFNYCGEEEGLPISSITEWHIGGRSVQAEEWINDYTHNSWPVFDEIRQEAQF
jgi:hypothetical protein